MMTLKETLKKTRSYRRFDQSYSIYTNELKNLVDLTRYTASARNAQVLKYIAVNSPDMCASIFPHIQWAGFLTDWDGPSEGERPTAYMLMMHDKTVANQYFCDDGIALQTLMLGATEMDFGGCIIGAFNKPKIAELFNLPETLAPLYLLALGKPIEEVVLEEIKEGDSKYWRSPDGVHHVPKRTINDILLAINEPL